MLLFKPSDFSFVAQIDFTSRKQALASSIDSSGTAPRHCYFSEVFVKTEPSSYYDSPDEEGITGNSQYEEFLQTEASHFEEVKLADVRSFAKYYRLKRYR